MAKLALAHPKLDLTDDRIILHYVRAPTTPAAHTRSRLHRHAHHCCRPCGAGVARTAYQSSGGRDMVQQCLPPPIAMSDPAATELDVTIVLNL